MAPAFVAAIPTLPTGKQRDVIHQSLLEISQAQECSCRLKTPAYLGGCSEAVRVIIKIVAMPHFPLRVSGALEHLCARLASVSALHVLVISLNSHSDPGGCT